LQGKKQSAPTPTLPQKGRGQRNPSSEGGRNPRQPERDRAIPAAFSTKVYKRVEKL